MAGSTRKLCKSSLAQGRGWPKAALKDGLGKKRRDLFFSESYKPHLVMDLLLLKEAAFDLVLLELQDVTYPPEVIL